MDVSAFELAPRCRAQLSRPRVVRNLAARIPRADSFPSELDFGQKFNGLAMVRGAKYGVREFLYCHGQAGTVKKFTGVSVYPANYAPPRAAKIGQSQAKIRPPDLRRVGLEGCNRKIVCSVNAIHKKSRVTASATRPNREDSGMMDG